jgi:integrase/recombinase XerD
MYIARRHQEGASYVSGAIILRSLCRHVGDVSIDDISSNDISAFLNDPRISAITRLGKFSIVTCFLRFLAIRRMMPFLAVPKPPKPTNRLVPYIYTRSEVRALLAAIHQCQKRAKKINPETFRCFLLTLYGTGARLDEVLNLRLSHVDLRHKRIRLGANLPNQYRWIPIGTDLVKVLRAQLRTISRRREGDVLIFRMTNGERINRHNIWERFRLLRQIAGVVRKGEGRPPRLQDFRPTFAVHRLASWIRLDVDLNAMMPALSTYMGYSSLTTAEQFLSYTPERFRGELRKLSPARGRKHWRDNPELMRYLTAL